MAIEQRWYGPRIPPTGPKIGGAPPLGSFCIAAPMALNEQDATLGLLTFNMVDVLDGLNVNAPGLIMATLQTHALTIFDSVPVTDGMWLPIAFGWDGLSLTEISSGSGGYNLQSNNDDSGGASNIGRLATVSNTLTAGTIINVAPGGTSVQITYQATGEVQHGVGQLCFTGFSPYAA